MTASGEYGGFIRTWDTDPASAEWFWMQAGLEGSPLDYDPLNFADRSGRWRLTFATALHASQAFAAAEQDLVDFYIRGWEQELRARGFEPGMRYKHDLLRNWAPSHALARSWCQQPRRSPEREVAQRRRGAAGPSHALGSGLRWVAGRRRT